MTYWQSELNLSLRFLIFTIAMYFASPAIAQYQLPGNSPIETSGVASVEKAAQRMRAIIPLKARGKTVKEASTSMDDVVSAAKVTLISLGADKDSFGSGKLMIDLGTSSQHRRMRLQMMGGRGGGGFGPFGRIDASGLEEEAGGAQLVMVKMNLVAEWQLTETGVDLLQRAFDLQNSINEASFGDEGEDEELSGEEAELIEEAEMFGGESSSGGNTPLITYVATITQDEYDSLQKQAYNDALKEAERMASISGNRLGKLATIRASVAGGRGDEYARYAMQEEYGSNATSMMEFLTSASPLVAIGKEVQGITFSTSIQLGFEFAAPTDP